MKITSLIKKFLINNYLLIKKNDKIEMIFYYVFEYFNCSNYIILLFIYIIHLTFYIYNI